MFKVKTKVLSSLQKCFIDENIDTYKEKTSFKVLKGQHLAFQVACMGEDEIDSFNFLCPVVEGTFSEYVTVREVIHIPSMYPAPILNADDNYLRTTPGLYPDPIRPLHYQGQFCLRPERTHCLWVESLIPEDIDAGEYEITLYLRAGKEGEIVSDKKTVKISIIDEVLPKQELVHTEWFYSDCIAEAHKVKVFSDEHFALIEKYIRIAVKNGINMILVPFFTPELDTYVGGERLTTQLIRIRVNGNKYEFDFELAAKFIKICKEAGVEYFEIPHFYTQWGAKHAPKIVAEFNGIPKQIFGWETDALSEEYKEFLSQLIPAILTFMNSWGIDKKCYFHVSDEPGVEQLDHYIACKNQIAPYLEGYSIIDALSSYEFYRSGALKKPVPYIAHSAPFIENNVEGLWTYYCGTCGGPNGTGRCHAMPSARTRILGVMLYHMNVEGFLHWGYNYYHNFCSYDFVNPMAESSGEYFAPSGDAFLVYPDESGALESQRLVAMREAMEDHRLLKLYESKFGREKTLSMLKELVGYELAPDKYPRNDEFFEKLFDRVVKDIKG